MARAARANAARQDLIEGMVGGKERKIKGTEVARRRGRRSEEKRREGGSAREGGRGRAREREGVNESTLGRARWKNGARRRIVTTKWSLLVGSPPSSLARVGREVNVLRDRDRGTFRCGPERSRRSAIKPNGRNDPPAALGRPDRARPPWQAGGAGIAEAPRRRGRCFARLPSVMATRSADLRGIDPCWVRCARGASACPSADAPPPRTFSAAVGRAEYVERIVRSTLNLLSVEQGLCALAWLSPWMPSCSAWLSSCEASRPVKPARCVAARGGPSSGEREAATLAEAAFRFDWINRASAADLIGSHAGHAFPGKSTP